MTSPDAPLPFGRRYRRLMFGVIATGLLLQLLLALFFLSIGHAPKPHDLPVGLVAGQQTAAITAKLEEGGSLAVTPYADKAALARAIKQRDVSGGLVVGPTGTTAYTAGAGGNLQAATLRAVAAQLDASAGKPPASTTVDVVPLPADDTNGAVVGYVLQVLALGGSVASLGLGRLIPRAPRSVRRGVGHAAALVAYALASAGVMLAVLHGFGVTAAASGGRLYVDMALLSLALTASTAGFVALIGPAGALAGAIYFLIGAPISSASLPWQFLSPLWAGVGASLPTGGGAAVVRSALYFPAATDGAAYLCLGLYAGIGVAVILVTNALGNRSNRTSLRVFDIVTPIAGRHRA
ncbi:membrane protein [Nocardioides phosphati]|uniref:Membrane protein n=1 Tax=Nocardioides phosphati TaxID=1867775 RepID=A0ABQ2N7W6_9ACTN|nr:ABC transporter permease [Nocardioides phosphati]GGO85937.1 membrane protein [Nocardioides phosphati]